MRLDIAVRIPCAMDPSDGVDHLPRPPLDFLVAHATSVNTWGWRQLAQTVPDRAARRVGRHQVEGVGRLERREEGGCGRRLVCSEQVDMALKRQCELLPVSVLRPGSTHSSGPDGHVLLNRLQGVYFAIELAAHCVHLMSTGLS